MLLTGDLTIGDAHRSWPTGGSAKGMPRNWATPGVVPLMSPYTGPTEVSTFKGFIAWQGSKTDAEVRRSSRDLRQYGFLHHIFAIVGEERATT